MIRYLQHSAIDKQKWDECIEHSINRIVYGYSWYLDGMAPGWDALVMGDYEAVFPLTHGRRYLMNYLFQPFFTQQLGVFYKTTLGRDSIPAFIDSIPRSYRLVDIQLNEGNGVEGKIKGMRKRRNFVLDLNKPYAKLVKNFSENAKRNLKKAKKNDLTVHAVDASEVIDFYIEHKGDETLNVKKADYDRLRVLAKLMAEKKMLITLSAKSAKGKPAAMALFISTPGRVIYLMGAASAEGRELRASYLLIDHIIHQFSEQEQLLDFEGSEISSLGRFYKGFGPEKKHYFKLYLNRLPWPLRWFR